MLKPKYTKEECRAMASYGYYYGGFIDGVYLYQNERRDSFNMPMYAAVYFLEEDMAPENMAFCFRHGLTRDAASVKKAQAKHRKAERKLLEAM